MRTDKEILARIEEVKDMDFFGFEQEDLIAYLSFRGAKPFLKDGVTKSDWSVEEPPEDKIRNYMPFAWEKANECRGLSAGRSISRMSAWCWLYSDKAIKVVKAVDYEYYGKPILVAICEFFGIDWEEMDSGFWGNNEDEKFERDAVFSG